MGGCSLRGEISGELFRCIPEIDFNLGYRYFLGNMDNYSKALMSMLKSIKAKLPILQNMNITQEYEGLRIITQTLRKMLTNVGATEVSEATYQLETALLNHSPSYIRDQLTDYIYTLADLSEHLEILLKRLDVVNTTTDLRENTCFLKRDFTKTKERIKLSKDFIDRKII